MPPRGGGTSTTETQVKLTPEQQQLMQLMMPTVTNYLKTPLQQFPGSQVADFTNNQTQGQQQVVDASKGAVAQIGSQAQDTLGQLMQGGAPTASSTGEAAASNKLLNGVGQSSVVAAPSLVSTPTVQGMDITNSAAAYAPTQNAALDATTQLGPGGVTASDPRLNSALNFLMGGQVLDPSTNPGLQGSIDAATRPLVQTFANTIMPGIRSGAIENGQLGSNREGIAQGLASRDLMNKIADTTAQIVNQNYQTGLNAMTGTTNTAQNNLTQALNVLLTNEAQKLGISADVLTKTIADQVAAQGNQLNAETQRQGIAQQATTSQYATQQQAASTQAGQNAQLLSNMLSDQTMNRQLTQNSQYQALSQADQTAILQVLPGILQSGVGDVQQAMDQAKLSEKAKKFIDAQMTEFAKVQQVAQTFFGQSGTTTTSSQGGSDIVGSLANTALSAALMFMLTPP